MQETHSDNFHEYNNISFQATPPLAKITIRNISIRAPNDEPLNLSYQVEKKIDTYENYGIAGSGITSPNNKKTGSLVTWSYTFPQRFKNWAGIIGEGGIYRWIVCFYQNGRPGYTYPKRWDLIEFSTWDGILYYNNRYNINVTQLDEEIIVEMNNPYVPIEPNELYY